MANVNTRIKIVSDSTCDLSDELLSMYDITILPMHVLKGGISYLDGIEISTWNVFEHVNSGGEICTTSATNVAEFQEYLNEVSSQYSAVIILTIGSGFSSCFQNAQIAAQKYTNVYVIDTRNLSSGQGLAVLEAARLAQLGFSAKEICTCLNKTVNWIDASFILDRLDYMKKGGRCSSVTLLGANMLHIKPCIEVVDGAMKVTRKYRGSFSKVIYQYTKDRLAQCKDVRTDRVFIVHPDAEPAAIEAARCALMEDGRFEKIDVIRAGCTVACHCGPNTLGVMFLRK